MPSSRQFPRLFGRGVRLAAIESATEKNPRWIQVAYEGQFVYRGRPITFDRALFEHLIKNFRAHPSFKAGDDGVGSANVVHFDYEHASELDPRVGSIPEKGVPAPAWVQDLEIREGEDGVQLWALAKLGKTILGQITADPPEYQWTSVAVEPHWNHPVTGEDMGPTLTSIAFTNDPFLQGMVPISIAASMSVWVDKAETPEQALIGMREIFGLPLDADALAVGEQLQRFGELLTGGVGIEGVDLDYMLASLKRLFAMPALSTRDEVLSTATASLSYDPSTQQPATSAGTSAETQMPLTKRLAATFRVNEHDDTILAAAEKVQASADAMDTLMNILGASDFQAAIAAAKGLVEKTSGMGEIVTQLAAAMERIGKVDEQDAEAEAEAVVASRVAKMNLPSKSAAKVAADELRPAILAMRKGCIDKDPKEQERKLAEFRDTYPLPPADRALLTRRIFAGSGGSQFGLQADQHGNLQSAPLSQPVLSSPPRTDGRSPERIAMCRDFHGANDIEKAMGYLRKEMPDFASLDRINQVRTAGKWLAGSN